MKKVIYIVMIIVLGCAVALLVHGGFGVDYEDKAIDVAKSYVSTQFYADWGDEADKIEAFVIYNGKDVSGDAEHLIGVRCYWNDILVGSYCVYAKLGTFRAATEMLAADFDFFSHMTSLKAMFGIDSKSYE